MIKSFARSQHGKRTSAFVAGERVPQFEEFAAQATRRLTILRDATCLQDLRSLPSNHFHALSGKLRGKYAIRVNARLRVVFGWDGEGAIDVEIIDYH